MSIIRTPDERFVDLPAFPFQPRYVEVNGLRVHYVDEGQGDLTLCFARRSDLIILIKT